MSRFPRWSPPVPQLRFSIGPWLLLLFLSMIQPGRAASAFIEEADFDNLGYSVVPIVGYDDKSGWLYGAA